MKIKFPDAVYSTGSDLISREKHLKQVISGRVSFKFAQFQFVIKKSPGSSFSNVILKKHVVWANIMVDQKTLHVSTRLVLVFKFA